jgi:ABC-type uncharacterized transport system involved in gliding motility auxiliary subunit
MNKRQLERLLYSAVGVAAMFLIVVVINFIASAAKVRLDLTEDKAFTLSQGTRAILKKLDAPVEIRFYFTQSEREIDPALRSFALRVEDLLDEYRQASGGKIRIRKYNPVPDSDAEDLANLDGIEPQVTPLSGEKFYFGLAVSQFDRRVPIPALIPQKERELEYEISRALAQLSSTNRPVLGVMTSLPMFGSPFNPMMARFGQQPQDKWIVLQELSKDFTVRQVNTDVEKIDDDIGILMVVHPKDLSDKTQYAIDQFVMRGGKLLAFLDPLCISDRPQNPNSPIPLPGGGSSLPKLLKAWGLEFESTKLVADPNLATPVSFRQGAPPERSFVFLSLTKAQFEPRELLTAGLNIVMLPLAGAFSGEPAPGLTKVELLRTTADTDLVDAMTAYFNNEQVKKDFKSSGKVRTLALRLTGKFKTAFPDGKPGSSNSDKQDEKTADTTLKESQGNPVVVLVGDADLLSDQASVRVHNILGLRFIEPFNNNLMLVQNMVEQLAGDVNLFAVRARSVAARPFTRVQRIQAEAEKEYQARIKKLEDDLRETQAKLNELQAKKEQGQKYILSKEQQEEILRFRKKEAEAKRDLKELRKQLRKRVDALETRVKWINILGMPVVVALVGLTMALVKANRTRAR